MSEEEKKAARAAIKAVCEIASSNFPKRTEVTISASGPNQGSISIPYYTLLALIEEPAP